MAEMIFGNLSGHILLLLASYKMFAQFFLLGALKTSELHFLEWFPPFPMNHS